MVEKVSDLEHIRVVGVPQSSLPAERGDPALYGDTRSGKGNEVVCPRENVGGHPKLSLI
jgi:hypothetical protein